MRAGLWDDAARAAECFAAGDPRRAASLDALATLAHRHGREREARDLRHRALDRWQEAEAWVDAMAVVDGARSSTFHVRLAGRHPGAYPEIVRLRHRRTLAAGRAGTEANRAALDDDRAALEAALAARSDAFGPRESGAAAIALRLGHPVTLRIVDRFAERPPARDDDERRLYAAALLAPVLPGT